MIEEEEEEEEGFILQARQDLFTEFVRKFVHKERRSKREEEGFIIVQARLIPCASAESSIKTEEEQSGRMEAC